jgi:hypothetical protein
MSTPTLPGMGAEPEWMGDGSDVAEPGPWAEPGQEIEPVRIEVVRRCEWKTKPCGQCGKAKSNPIHGKKQRDAGAGHKFARKLGCERCGKPKNDPDHLGAPESFNLFTHGSWEAYQSAKQRWHAVLRPQLRLAGLPRGLSRVLVEGECSFGDGRERDQGNHRVIIEKALGDVLVEDGYLENDKWGRYEFGNLTLVEEGVNRLRLLVIGFPPEQLQAGHSSAMLGGVPGHERTGGAS